MHHTIEALIKGDNDISMFYTRAMAHWRQILAQPISIEDLAHILGAEQYWFEANCGGRYVGQEIMAITGIAQFYETQDGFGERKARAQHVYDAFQISTCSGEVFGIVSQVAESYHLHDPST